MRRQKYLAIIQAASKVFLSKGFAAAGVDEIAEVAGVSKRTLYKYFGSKDKLLGEIVVQKSADLTAGLDISMQDAAEPHATLKHLAANYLQLVLSPESIDLYRLVVTESSRFPDLARVFHENGAVRLRRALAAQLTEWDAGGVVSVPEPEIAADQFFGACVGSLRIRALFDSNEDPFPASLDQWIDTAVTHCLTGWRYRAQ